MWFAGERVRKSYESLRKMYDLSYTWLILEFFTKDKVNELLSAVQSRSNCI